MAAYAALEVQVCGDASPRLKVSGVVELTFSDELNYSPQILRFF